MKKNKGFTLVELIVVVAIISILAAVAVPMSINYVKKARLETDANLLRSIISSAISRASAIIAEEGGEALYTTESIIVEILSEYQYTNLRYEIVELVRVADGYKLKEANNNKVIGIYIDGYICFAAYYQNGKIIDKPPSIKQKVAT